MPEFTHTSDSSKSTAFYHLPGLFEFYELYKLFIPLFYEYREYFYNWCDIGSIYGAPSGFIWAGGRIEAGGDRVRDVFALLRDYGISARLAFSNLLLRPEHLVDKNCNEICAMLARDGEKANGVVVGSDLLLFYLIKKYPELYYVSSTTKVITDFEKLKTELERSEFKYVVPDFRLNKIFSKLETLPKAHKDKLEFLCNEGCFLGCKDRRRCYESVSRKVLGIDDGFACSAPDSKNGYVFSRAMESPAFISVEDIQSRYMPIGFSNFKIEGRGLGSALVLEFLLYYLTKPECRLRVREKIYLSNTLDLF